MLFLSVLLNVHLQKAIKVLKLSNIGIQSLFDECCTTRALYMQKYRLIEFLEGFTKHTKLHTFQ